MQATCYFCSTGQMHRGQGCRPAPNYRATPSFGQGPVLPEGYARQARFHQVHPAWSNGASYAPYPYVPAPGYWPQGHWIQGQWMQGPAPWDGPAQGQSAQGPEAGSSTMTVTKKGWKENGGIAADVHWNASYDDEEGLDGRLIPGAKLFGRPEVCRIINVPGQTLDFVRGSTGEASPSGWIDRSNVRILNIDRRMNSWDLANMFSPWGTVISARVMVNESGRSEGWGFVSLSRPEEAAAAMAALHGTRAWGVGPRKTLSLNLHRPKLPKTPEDATT